MRLGFSAFASLSALAWTSPSAAAAVPVTVLHADIGGPALLGTLAIPIKADRFGDSLRRAHEDASSSPILQRLIAPVRRLGRAQQLVYVQSVVSSNIRWASDTTQWGQHDYWASASQTLACGAGDMEDRAIVKMQMLKALGFDPSSLFLTLARDRVGGPETVLTVHLGAHYYILDDTGGAPFPVEQRHYEFQPIISFGWNGAWLHMGAPSPNPATTTAAATGIVRAQARP
jgi:predicted transglutaminase-like cysteine proteinase